MSSAIGQGVTALAVGDPVVAFVPGSLASHVIADARLAAPMPASITFDEAATIAGGFLTAHYGLSELAKITRNDRVLIHAATGGVGLAAVQLAQRAGATVYATAGSEEKRAALRALGVQHVFSSRDTGFAEQIEALTNHAGVTIVLNSLTGEILERSVDVLAPNGRFVELGMGSEMSDSARARFVNGAMYFNPNVAAEAEVDPARFGRMLRTILAAIAEQQLAPLPQTVFDSRDVASAFRFMARAAHIGKVVIRTTSRTPAPIVAHGTYLVIGGLGGLGLLVTQWLAERGAQYVAIMARREPSADETFTLDELRSRGVNVAVLRGDVSNAQDVRDVVARIGATMPRLRGVFQSAGVLDDGMLEAQTWDRFTRVMNPKVAGAWNLHEATSRIDLDHFVLFSSDASLLGS